MADCLLVAACMLAGGGCSAAKNQKHSTLQDHVSLTTSGAKGIYKNQVGHLYSRWSEHRWRINQFSKGIAKPLSNSDTSGE